MDHPKSDHVASSSNVLKKIDHRKGLRRLWLVATLAWFLAVVVANVVPISFWAGYHYGLRRQSGSFRLAAAEEQKMRAIIAACC